MTKLALLLGLLSHGLGVVGARAHAARPAAAPVAPVTSVTVEGLSAAVGPARQVEFACDNESLNVLCGDPRTHVHVLVPITLVNHSADTIIAVFDTEFRLIAGDATTYPQEYCDHGGGFGPDNGALHPGQRTTGTLCFSVPRTERPAALYWDPPFRLDSPTVTHPSTDTAEQLMPLPVAPGQRPAPLRPAGPRGAVAQFGVTLTVGVVRRAPAPPSGSLGQDLPPDLAVDVVPVRLVNHSPATLHYRDADLVLLDAQGREYAATEQDARFPGLGGFESELPSGAQVAAAVAFIVPVGITPVAVRWQPSRFTRDAALVVGVEQVVLLPGSALPPPPVVVHVSFVARHSAADGYTLYAPSTWQPVATAHLVSLVGPDLTLTGTDLALEAPDQHAFVAAGVQATGGQAATTAALEHAADTLIDSLSTQLAGNAITHRTGQDHGLPYVLAAARITTTADWYDDVAVLSVVRGTQVYTLVGAVTYMGADGTLNPQHKQELHDLDTVFARFSVP